MKTKNAMQLKVLINSRAKAVTVSPQLMLRSTCSSAWWSACHARGGAPRLAGSVGGLTAEVVGFVYEGRPKCKRRFVCRKHGQPVNKEARQD